jgi:hypothetical protein
LRTRKELNVFYDPDQHQLHDTRRLRVEASGHSPLDLDLSPDGGGMMANVYELEDGPTRKAIEMRSTPMNSAYIATIRSEQATGVNVMAQLQ